jgi:hypothetical protein
MGLPVEVLVVPVGAFCGEEGGRDLNATTEDPDDEQEKEEEEEEDTKTVRPVRHRRGGRSNRPV